MASLQRRRWVDLWEVPPSLREFKLRDYICYILIFRYNIENLLREVELGIHIQLSYGMIHKSMVFKRGDVML